MIDREPECLLRCVDNQLRSELQAFWRQHQEPFQAELISFRALHGGSAALFSQPGLPLSRHPAVIARDEAGSIIGIVYVALSEIDSSLNLGMHVYFQKMYIAPGARRGGVPSSRTGCSGCSCVNLTAQSNGGIVGQMFCWLRMSTLGFTGHSCAAILRA